MTPLQIEPAPADLLIVDYKSVWHRYAPPLDAQGWHYFSAIVKKTKRRKRRKKKRERNKCRRG